ncbi:MAG: hypothetical protein JWL70_1363, partial [Acidimicrobiia bacterium]|nr:hypothetical protein [Acidimicrobiia bacterium]
MSSERNADPAGAKAGIQERLWSVLIRKRRSTSHARRSRFLRLTVVVAMLGAVLAATAGKVPNAVAGGSGSDLGSNGQHRRAFYNFGHNPNELSEVTGDLAAGANALEPDVMSFTDAAVAGFTNINSTAGASGLFMYHDHVIAATRLPTTVEDWLEAVHTKVVDGSNVALIAFDIKSAAATSDNGKKLLDAVHAHLNYGGVNVNVIFSVASEADGGVFSQIIPLLGAREGVMIDADNDPVKIYNYFDGLGAAGHIAYGNGSLGVQYGFAPNVLLGIEEASWARAGQVPAFAIPYAYPISLESDMDAFITAGADGLIPDVDFPIVAPGDTQTKISNLAAKINARNDIYMATAADDPLHPVVEAYGLRVVTRDDVAGAGTDSNITFTLSGCNGTSSVTVNTDFIGHMESGDVNFVTLPSKDLGKLQSLTLSSDGSHGGILQTQEWDPGLIEISSANFGIPYSDHRGATFSSDIDSDTPATKALAGWGNKCAASTALASSLNPSTYGQSVKFTATVTPAAGSTAPTGTVNFFDGATSIGSVALTAGSASISTTALTAGTHSVTAKYSGDDTFMANVSAVVSQNVAPAATTTALLSSVNPSVFGQPVALTATVSAVAPGAGTPTGTLKLLDGTVQIGTGSLVGGSLTVTTSSFAVASHSITAVYVGDANFKASTSATLTQVVNRAPTATTLTAAPAGTATFGNPVTFTATVNVPAPGAGTPTGPVVFTVDGTTVQTVNLNAALQAAVTTTSLGAGNHIV